MSRRLLVIGLAALATVLTVVLVSGDSSEDDVGVTLDLQDAGGLRVGSLVRVGGAPVGSVKSIDVTAANTARAVLSVDRDAHPGRGARASVRASNLLGEKFVDLDLGDRARPLQPARLGLRRTSTPVEIDDVIDVLDPRTRDRLGVLIATLGIALDRRGEDLRASLAVLPRTVEDATELLAQLSEDTEVLERLLTEADTVTRTVAAERRPLGRLVASGARAFAAPAAKRKQLEATLAETPATLVQLRDTLRRLDAAGEDLRPAARGLRTTAPVLTRTLRALPGFATDARPALRAAVGAGPSLRRLGRQAAPTVRRLRTTSETLAATARDADTVTRRLDETFAADLLGVMQGWAQAIQTRDGVSHLFRVSLSFTPDVLRGLGRYVTGSWHEGRRRPAARAPKNAANAQTPTDRDAGRGVVDGVKERAKDRVDAAAEPLVPVVEDVERALGGLLGGGKPARGAAPQSGASILDLLRGR